MPDTSKVKTNRDLAGVTVAQRASLLEGNARFGELRKYVAKLKEQFLQP